MTRRTFLRSLALATGILVLRFRPEIAPAVPVPEGALDFDKLMAVLYAVKRERPEHIDIWCRSAAEADAVRKVWADHHRRIYGDQAVPKKNA